MEIKERIIRTVCYFDLFDYPLTRAEVFRWLYGGRLRIGVGEVDKSINDLIASNVLKEYGGFVYLADRDQSLVATRETRYRHSCRKWKRARRWAGIFSAIPGIELVGIGNTLAYNNAKDGSDIDFFMVTAPGEIWRARFFCAALAAILNLRPRPDDNRDKLCLSFFIDRENLDLSAIARDFAAKPSAAECPDNTRDEESEIKTDVYLEYWIRQMLPLAGKDEVATRWRAQNRGAEERSLVKSPPFFWRVIFMPIAFLPGVFAKRWQQRNFPTELRHAEGKNDGSVIISDKILKFHVGDQRRVIYERWENRVDSILDEDHKNNQSN